MAICSNPECDRPVWAKGLCNTCYGRQYRAARPCPVDGCGKPSSVIGLCGSHYRVWLAENRPPCATDGCDRPVRSATAGLCESCYRTWVRDQKSVECCVVDCDRPASTRGRCVMHYQRWLISQRPPCSVEGCDRPTKALGLCGAHWKQRKVQQDPVRARKSHLKRNYRLSLDEYDRMFAEQAGLCAICGQPEPRKGWALPVDHDHRTGQVRKLVCSKHNSGLGLFDDDPEILRRAAAYLESFAPIGADPG